MLRFSVNGLVYYTFPSFRNITCAFFTRLGGASRPPFDSLNVGHTVGDDLNAVEENHRRIFKALGISRSQVVTARQVHGLEVALVDERHAGKVVRDADGLVTSAPGIFLMLRFADCVPVVLYDPVKRAVGLLHAGWKGSIMGIAFRAVELMREAFGSRPEEILAGIGPSIGPCCYEVGEDVAGLAREFFPDPPLTFTPQGKMHLDLWELNRRWLLRAGVKEVEIARLCTFCHSDEFFSHRASRGLTGRFAAVVGINGGPGGEAPMPGVWGMCPQKNKSRGVEGAMPPPGGRGGCPPRETS